MHLSLRLAYLASILWVAAVSAADFPLVADRLVTGPNAHVQLTNTGKQAVTAWSLATTTKGSDGRSIRQVETVDGYLSEVTEGLPGSSARLNRLMAGQSREMALDPLPPDASVQVVAVVLDDGTAMGEEQAIAAVFERRIRERNALGAVVAAFNDVLPATQGMAALAALRERLQAIAQHEASVPCRAALDAVETYQQRANAGGAATLDDSLRTYAAFVARQYELARKHSERK